MRAEQDDFEEPLKTLGRLLAERGLRYELVAIGGGALQLLGLITRPTRDIDVVALVEDATLVPVAALPAPLQRAVSDTARLLRLPVAWFNAGPRSLMDFGLPDGLLSRAHRRDWEGLVLHIADRRDQVFFKLYAAVDQGPRSKHLEDLRRLDPTSAGFENELRGLLREQETRDSDP